MSQLVLAQLAGSAGYGGGERYLEWLLAGLDRAKFRPLVICPESGPFVQKLMKQGVAVAIISLEPLMNPLALLELARLLKRERVAVLQTHGARANVYGRLAGRIAGVHYIVSTVHNAISDYEVSPLKRWVYKSILRMTEPLADRTICVSEAIRQAVVADCPGAAAKTVTIYNGVDPASFTQRGRDRIRREWCTGPGPVLLTVARLTAQKGHRYLLDALPALLKEWPGVCCLFVGDGEGREALRALAREQDVEHACRFVGATDAVTEFYAAADVVVLPSLSEGFPFVVLEALAMARPVVATAVNGVPEIIEDGMTGRLVPARNAPALAAAIGQVLRNRETAARMGEAGRARVAAKFTAERMVRETIALLEAGVPASMRVPPPAERTAA